MLSQFYSIPSSGCCACSFLGPGYALCSLTCIYVLLGWLLGGSCYDSPRYWGCPSLMNFSSQGYHLFPFLFPLKINENNQEKKYLLHYEQTCHFFQENNIIFLSLPECTFSVSFYDQVSHSPAQPLWQLSTLDKDPFLHIRIRVIPGRHIQPSPWAKCLIFPLDPNL